MSEAIYEEVVSDFTARFSKLVENTGRTMQISSDWESAWLIGGSTLVNRTFTVHLSGGLARVPGMGPSSLAFVLCHELGHLLGGEPRQPPQSGASWASVEGQADDWATRACLKKWATENPTLFAQATVRPEVTSACAQSLDRRCKDQIGSALEFFEAVESLGVRPLPQIGSPDPSIVSVTLWDYPSAQCRLDTSVRAALSRARPRCWFHSHH